MKGAFIIIGESFRSGNTGQGDRLRDLPNSYNDQVEALKSHIVFLEHLKENKDISLIDIYISSYKTIYESTIKEIYNSYLKKSIFYSSLIGLNNLFHKTLESIDNIESYDWIFYFRIDLFLKSDFIKIFNPYWNTIYYPTICWKKDSVCHGYPRINDTMIFIPKRLYYTTKSINIFHDCWFNLENSLKLGYENQNTMINTYHDSDSAKDWNPLYRIVNRPETNVWHSKDEIFDKNIFISK